MARLPTLPSLDIIHGFQGVLDFYLWKGLPCARKWPYTPPSHVTEGTLAARAIFGAISHGYSLLADAALQAFRDDAADQTRTARDIYMTATLGHLHTRTVPEPPPPPEEEMYDAYVHLRDKKAQGTAGGTFMLGAWRTRDLNEEAADPENICALAANQFVLAAGTYRAMISCPAYIVDKHQARLYNLTGAAVLLLGTSEFLYTGHPVTNRSHIAGRFTVAAGQTLEVQHRASNSNAGDGFGYPANFTDEIYTIVELWREIEPE